MTRLAALARRALLAAALVPAVLPAQGLTATAAERAIARAVDQRVPEAIRLLERIVNINSGTMNFAGVRAVGDVLRARLDALGFRTRWEDGAAYGRAGHLVAEHPAPGPRLLLIGHLDTVFEPSSPFQKMEFLPDSMARGPGIIDMKGGDVVMLLALEALQATGKLAALNVTIVLHGDEEHAGVPQALARRTLVEAARGADAAIGFEDGAGDVRTGIVARRGASSWRLDVTGEAAHSSQIFKDSIGYGAIFETARILDQFRVRLAGEPYLTFNPGVALGGARYVLDSAANRGSAEGKTNIVAERMTVQGDLRTLTPEQLERARATMRAIVAQSLSHTRATISFDDGYPPMAPTDGNRALLALHDTASRALGLGAVSAVDPGKAGAADVSFVAGLVPRIIDGVGLAGHDDHSPQETADLRTLAVRAKRAALTMTRLAAALAPRP
jgi:glutamate carboxypeptidase